MILSVLQENLSKSLSTVLRAVEAKAHIPILENVLLETEDSRLKLSGTSLDLSISAWIGAKVEQSGSITLPAKTLSELVNSLSPERVDLRLDGATHRVELRCGLQQANISGKDADDYPPINHNETADFQISGETLREMISQTVFAAAKEINRPILTGVYVQLEGQELTMAAADGYRLAVRTCAIEQDFEERQTMVVPAKTMMAVASIIGDESEVGISLPDQRNSISFLTPNVLVSSQLLEGRFPDFASIIPRSFTTSTVLYTNDLLAVCQRAEIFARDNANCANLEVTPAGNPGEPADVTIVGKSAERGDVTGRIDATAEGEALEISFNIRYLIDVLRVIKEERVLFESNGRENPGVIKPEGRDDFVHVIMPMSK